MGINSVHLSGNLTRDVEMRATPGGMSILQFGLAFNDRRKNPQTGQWEDLPNYVECVLFGNRADAMSRILTKGMHVAIEGKLRWSSWEDKNTGQKRSKIEVIVNEIDLMSPRQDGYQPKGQYAQAPRAPQMPAPAPQTPQFAPQVQQGYANPPQQQMAPQTAPQQPTASPYGSYQPTQQPSSQQQTMDMYSEDIPF